MTKSTDPNAMIFHGAAQTGKEGMYHPKAPTPFQMIGGMVADTVKNAGKLATKVASTIMGPTVNAMKIEDAKMKEMSRKAKSGEFNR